MYHICSFGCSLSRCGRRANDSTRRGNWQPPPTLWSFLFRMCLSVLGGRYGPRCGNCSFQASIWQRRCFLYICQFPRLCHRIRCLRLVHSGNDFRRMSLLCWFQLKFLQSDRPRPPFLNSISTSYSGQLVHTYKAIQSLHHQRRHTVPLRTWLRSLPRCHTSTLVRWSNTDRCAWCLRKLDPHCRSNFSSRMRLQYLMCTSEGRPSCLIQRLL